VSLDADPEEWIGERRQQWGQNPAILRGAFDDEDEHCCWCQRGGEMQSFEGRLFCGEACANAWWYEWGTE
jgi:hypothetical protein